MNTTTQIAHDHALRGLMLLLVEVQNQAREAYASEPADFDTKRIAALEQIFTLVESPETTDLLQLARVALETPVPPAPCGDPLVDRVMGVICVRCWQPVALHALPAAIPAAAAGVHE